MARTRQINRLRALLLGSDDTDRDLSRGTLTGARLQAIARRRARASDTTEQSMRRAEARRLANAIRAAAAELAANKRHFAGLVRGLAPALLDKTGVGPVSAAQAIVSCPSRPHQCGLSAGVWPAPASSSKHTTRQSLPLASKLTQGHIRQAAIAASSRSAASPMHQDLGVNPSCAAGRNATQRLADVEQPPISVVTRFSSS